MSNASSHNGPGNVLIIFSRRFVSPSVISQPAIQIFKSQNADIFTSLYVRALLHFHNISYGYGFVDNTTPFKFIVSIVNLLYRSLHCTPARIPSPIHTQIYLIKCITYDASLE